jgi:GT2 family glycosyltransferase/glycosyltransferase involved in cell wall biosynthesis
MILFVSYSGAFGGAERLLVDYASALRGDRWLACPEGPLAAAARAAGLRVFPLPARSLSLRGRRGEPAVAAVRLAAHARELRALAADLDPELIVAWGMRTAIAALAAGRPYVFGHNDLVPGPLVGAAVRRAARHAVRTLVLSHAIAEDLGRPATVIHPGVDVDAWPAGSESATPPEVVVLGALVGWKAPELALEALAVARRERPELRLRFVGAPLDGDTTVLDALRRRAESPDVAGAVAFGGFMAEPGAALARATCLLHCAPREPFGLAILESLACGRPAVVPDAAGPAEIVDDTCGVLYPPGDAAAAGRALASLAGDPGQAVALGRAGRERARGRFDVRRARDAFTAAIADAVAVARPGQAPAGDGAGMAIVTVTHDSAAVLPGLLDSVARHLPGARTIAVDCASGDDSVAIARSRSGVASIALAENVGFGAGCNRGVAAVTEPVTVLLNPDVELIDGSLAALGAALRAGPERLLAPCVLTGTGGREDSVHPVPASFADLVAAVVPPALLPGTAVAPWRARRPRRVGWAVGCAIAAHTDTLRRLGPFDERIFLYGEDLDLGLRAARAGVPTWFSPQARVIHHRAHATRAAFAGEPFERLAGARRNVVARRLGDRRARLDDAAQAITFAARVAAKPLLRRSAERERRQLAALRAARRGGGDG